jgi:NAD-dependent oxidoreductase involved in siderophore biosynthesis
LLFKHFGVIDVMTAQSVAPRSAIMATLTINEQNEIVAFATPEEAAATTATPFDAFSSQQELAELAASWPAERLVAILNCLAGEQPVKKLKDAKMAIVRIWERIQGLGEPAKPEAEPAKPKADKKPKAGAQAVSLLF